MAIIEDPRKKGKRAIAKRPVGTPPPSTVGGSTPGGVTIQGSGYGKNEAAINRFLENPKKPVVNNRRAPARSTQAMVSKRPSPVAKPEYATKENSDMGWQARIAHNKSLDANYREQLGNTSAEGIAEGRNQTILQRSRQTNQGAMDRLNVSEAGDDRRLEVKNVFAEGQQRNLFGQQTKLQNSKFDRQSSILDQSNEYQTERDSTLNDYTTDAAREKMAMDALAGGNIENQGQAYAMSQYGPAGVPGLKPTPQKASKNFTRVDPKFGPSGKLLSLGGAFDETTGQTSYTDYTDDEILKMLDDIKKGK